MVGYVVQGLEICLERVALTPQEDITLEMLLFHIVKHQVRTRSEPGLNQV